MSRTIRIVLPFLLALSLILAGCAQPTAAPAPQGPADAEEQPAEAPAEVSEPAGEPAAEEEPEAEEITLTYWAVVPTQLQFDALYERFQELYPNIKIDFRQFQDAGEYGQQLATALSSGEGPDMFMVFNNQVNRFENFTEPVEERLNAEWGSDWQDLFIPVAIPGATSSSGKIVGIPIGVESQEYILYNQTLAEELGIQMPPKNYEELVAIVNQVRESGQDIIPLALGAKDKWHITGFYIQIANQFGPGKVYQAEAGEIPWTDPALVDAMKAWKQMFDDGLFQEGAVGLATYPDARDQYYYSRKALMFPTGSWHVGSYALPPNGEKMGTAIEGDATNAFLFPQIGPYESVATASISWIQAINKDAPAEKKEAAWKWFDYFTKDEGAQIFTDLLQASPVVKGMTPRTLDQLPFESDRESVRMLVDALANAQGAMRFQYPELEEAVGTALQEVATGQKTPEEALQDVQAVSDLIER